MNDVVQSVYVKKPFQFEFRDIQLREPGLNEVRLEVLACGICGFDMETSKSLANEFKPIGHEICGRITQVGPNVSHVKVGDQVVLESSSFCGVCPQCRNGRVDLCVKAPNLWSEKALGFSSAMVVNAHGVLPAPDLEPTAAALAEPCGVALDVCKVAEIKLTDRVLVVGSGAIGLMALAIARKLTAGTLVAADVSDAKLAIARKLGADHTVNVKSQSLATCGEGFGGFDKVLVTAPPTVLPDCFKCSAFGAIIVFIGSDFDGGGVIPIDTHALHFGKMQLRASFAAPALYLPEVLTLIRRGVVPADQIVSHRFPLSRITDGFKAIREQRDATRKVMIIPDALFQG